jgi:hypothetical protein
MGVFRVWVGRDSNPKPTPKAPARESFRSSGLLSLAAQRLQSKNSESRILFAFQLPFERASFSHRRDLRFSNKLDATVEAMSCVIVAALMFGNAALQIIRGTNIVPSGFASQYVNPSHD